MMRASPTLVRPDGLHSLGFVDKPSVARSHLPGFRVSVTGDVFGFQTLTYRSPVIVFPSGDTVPVSETSGFSAHMLRWYLMRTAGHFAKTAFRPFWTISAAKRLPFGQSF